MTGFYQSAAGAIRLEWTSADVLGSLDAVTEANITVSDIRMVDAVTVRFTVARSQFPAVKALAERKGEKLRPVRRYGLYWSLKRIFQRKILAAGMTLLLVTGIWLADRILLIEVEGNERIPQRQILEAADSCGICFGVSRRAVRSEQMKNLLLEKLPDLKWAGINTYGCRAVITVREEEPASPDGENGPVCHVIASRDAVITQITAYSGSALVGTGQAVKAGQILISGHTDCGQSILSGRAEGEVIADTVHHIKAVMPTVAGIRQPDGKKLTRYALKIGKKRINFYKGSGISDGSCVKMSMEYVLTLPGDFKLPVIWIRETVTTGVLTEETKVVASQELQRFVEDYLKDQMIAGRILGKTERIAQGDGVLTLTGSYICSENIGRIQEEKIGEQNGKADGTDRERGSGG